MIELSLGRRIKESRKLLGLTQEQLAKKANISRTYLADVERDRYNPSLETLKLIADALNVAAGALLEEFDFMNKSAKEIDEEFKELMPKIEKLSKEDKEIIKKLIDKLGGN